MSQVCLGSNQGTIGNEQLSDRITQLPKSTVWVSIRRHFDRSILNRRRTPLPGALSWKCRRQTFAARNLRGCRLLAIWRSLISNHLSVPMRRKCCHAILVVSLFCRLCGKCCRSLETRGRTKNVPDPSINIGYQASKATEIDAAKAATRGSMISTQKPMTFTHRRSQNLILTPTQYCNFEPSG